MVRSTSGIFLTAGVEERHFRVDVTEILQSSLGSGRHDSQSTQQSFRVFQASGDCGIPKWGPSVYWAAAKDYNPVQRTTDESEMIESGKVTAGSGETFCLVADSKGSPKPKH